MDSHPPSHEGASPTHRRVVVLGGGISGLAGASFLTQRGVTVTLLESHQRLGGAIQSELEAGYLTELGPNTIQLTSRIVENFILELGLESESLEPHPSAHNRYVVRNDRLYAVPASLVAGALTGLFRFRGKLRLLADLWVKKKQNDTDESLADFVRRRIGQEFLDYAINPMVGGIYAGVPERLSTKYAFPKIHRLEQDFGGLLKGAWGIRRRKNKDKSAFASKMLSFRDGMETLPRKLELSLGNSIAKGVQVSSISQQSGGWQVSWIPANGGQPVSREFDAIVSTVPAHAVSRLPWPSSLQSEMQVFSQVEYPPVTSVSLGFSREQVRHPLAGFGMLIPEKEKRSILGTLFSSSMFENRAPPGKVQLTTFVGGARQPELALANRQQLIESVIRDNSELLGISGAPEYAKVTVWKQAIPQYNVGYGSILEGIETIEHRWNGLHFCGNFRSGISVEKCILGAAELAGRLTNNLFETN